MHRASSRTRSRALAALAAAALGLAGAVAAASPAHAVTYPVANEADLISAINAANVDADEDAITITGPITLTAALPQITTPLTIDGGGNTLTAGGFSAITATGGAAQVSVSNLTIAGALTGVGGGTDAMLTVTDVTVTSPTVGGIVVSDASLIVNGATVTGSTGAFGVFVQNLVMPRTIELTDLNVSGSTAGHGIIVASGFGDATVTGGSSTGNSGEGYSLAAIGDATIDVSGVTASGNSNTGIHAASVDSSSITVTSPTVHGTAATTGILMEAEGSGSVVLDGGTVDASATGIVILPDSSTAQTQALDFTASGNDVGVLAQPHGDGTVLVRDATVRNNGDLGISITGDAEPDSGGVVIVERTTVSENGVGILMAGSAVATTLHVIDSTVDDNGDASVPVGGIDVTLDDEEEFSLQRSTVSNNEAFGTGGVGVSTGADSSVGVTNSTITGNESTGSAALFISGDGAAVVRHSTIADNTLGSASAVGLRSATTDLNNTIVTDGLDVTAGSISYSLITGGLTPDADVLATAGPGNILGQDPMLDTLADNGGYTMTRLALPGSPVINGGDPAFAPLPDVEQRGTARVVDGRIDIGAVETSPALAATGANVPWWAPVVAVVLVLLGVAGVVVGRMRRRGAHRA